MAGEDDEPNTIDLEALDLGDMARHARTATFAVNWKSVLAADGSIGLVLVLVGVAVVYRAGWAGWLLIVAGGAYIGLVVRRFLQWRWIRRKAGLS